MVGEEGRDAVRADAGCGREGDRDRASELFWGNVKENGVAVLVCVSPSVSQLQDTGSHIHLLNCRNTQNGVILMHSTNTFFFNKRRLKK